METITFLNHIFHTGIPKDKSLCVWTHPDKVSGWFNTTAKAALYIERREQSSDEMVKPEIPLQTYFGVNLVDLKPKKEGFGYIQMGSTERGKKDNISHLNCLVADIDIAGDNHNSNKIYPMNESEAMRIIDSFPIYPTLVVNSGGGFHCYWVFDKPAKNVNCISEKWGILLQNCAGSLGFEIDSVFDVSRVLRPVGTKNRKQQTYKLVDVVNHQYDYVEESTILKLIKDIEYTPKAKPTSTPTKIKPAKFPQDKFDRLMENESFKQAWNMTRNGKDNSPSAHEMSVVYYCYLAEMNDDEVFAIMAKFRDVHKLPMKHTSYYNNTMFNAKQSVERNTAIDNIETAINVVQETGDKNIVDQNDMMKWINQVTDIEFTSFIKMVMDEPTYIAYVGDRKIPLGPVGNILREDSFRGKIAAGIDKIMQKVGKQWEKVAQAILLCSEKINMGNYGSDTGMMMMWVQEYITSAQITTEIDDALSTGNPYQSVGYIFISGDDLRRWINTAKGESITSKKMGVDLRTIGAEPMIMNGIVDDKRTTRSLWKIALSSVEG